MPASRSWNGSTRRSRTARSSSSVRVQRRLLRPPARRDALRRGGDPAHQCQRVAPGTAPRVALGPRDRRAQFESSDAYSDLQRDVMRYAEEVTRHINASESLLERLHASLSDREIVELSSSPATPTPTSSAT